MSRIGKSLFSLSISRIDVFHNTFLLITVVHSVDMAVTQTQLVAMKSREVVSYRGEPVVISCCRADVVWIPYCNITRMHICNISVAIEWHTAGASSLGQA